MSCWTYTEKCSRCSSVKSVDFDLCRRFGLSVLPLLLVDENQSGSTVTTSGGHEIQMLKLSEYLGIQIRI